MDFGKKLLLMISGLCLILTIGCVPSAGTKATVTSGQGGPSINEAQMEAYDGPKARIAVAQFTNKTADASRWWSPAIGDGMSDQLTTALFNTNRYIVLERQTLGSVIAEQDLGASGRIKQGTQAAIGEIEGAELLVVGAITEFSGNSAGGGGGIGGIGGGLLGGIVGGFEKAHMAIDVRVIDAKTSRILAATSVEGEATNVKLGGGLAGGALAAGLGGWKNTPMEKAMRICIQRATEFIASKTPQRYYRHGQGMAQPSQPKVQTQTAQPAQATTPALSRTTIKEMQTHLNTLGYNVGKPDGISGKKTRQGVLDFQWKYKLKETGELDPPTIKKIREVVYK